MKISLSWVFDHIDADWQSIRIEELVDRFNQTTAEIEGWRKVSFDPELFTLAYVTSVSPEQVKLTSPEWEKEFQLSSRPEAVVDRWFLVKRVKNEFSWATLQDLGGAKEGLLAPLAVDETFARGQWKALLEKEDYILELDNKSVTNRPDMWGHRGFAREVAAIFELPLVPLDTLCVDATIQQSAKSSRTSKSAPFGITIQDQEGCSRFAGAYVPDVDAKASLLWFAHRLCRVDAKPISALVDGTNYAMLDIGHPMHAFDAESIPTKKIVVRQAYAGEALTLLDEQTIELDPEDMVIADNGTALSLAGIMGGMNSGVSEKTKDVFLEAACFDAATIRRTATRHKLRSEASARFEKGMDAEQVPHVLTRYLALMRSANIIGPGPYTIVLVGPKHKPTYITLAHTLLEERLGTTVTSEFVLKTLSTLGFDVTIESKQGAVSYRVEVPSFRATKDVTIPEDLIEEIGRFVGYDTIPCVMPSIPLAASDIRPVEAIRTIKRLFAYGLDMQEIASYAIYDEDFLRQITYEPTATVEIQNPVSDNWRRMVTSLAPHLIKAVAENGQQHDVLRFFEWARVWHQTESINERRRVGGIFFNKKEPVDFFSCKADLQRVFDLRKLSVTWHRIDTPEHPWLAPHTCAQLQIEGQPFGYAGLVRDEFLHQVIEGRAFVFELDASMLATYRSPIAHFEPLPKYPDVSRDMSVLIPLQVTVAELQAAIRNVDQRIVHIELIDFFELDEWPDKRALTFRFVIRDMTKTLVHQEIDAICAQVLHALTNLGAEER